MTDPHQSPIAIDEARWTRRAFRFLPLRQHSRRERILREGVQHVGQQKLLMLLLVLQAKLDKPGGVTRHALAELHHRRIDMGAEGMDACG